MKISTIICTYNSEENLSETLDSLLTQIFEDFEVVIVDGSSTDRTVDVIKEYEKKFLGRLRWISEKDKGVYDAMNKGIEISKGEWLYFLGSGDLLSSAETFEIVAKKLNDQDLDVVYGNIEIENSGAIYYGEFTKKKLMKGNIPHQAIFFGRNIFDIFGNYDLEYKTLADWVFNMKWFNSNRVNFCYFDVVVAKFELGGVSRTVFDQKFYDDFFYNIKKFFPEEVVKDFSWINKLGFWLFRGEFFWRFWKWLRGMVF